MTIEEKNTSTALKCDCKNCHMELLGPDEESVIEQGSLLGWQMDGDDFDARCTDCLKGNCPGNAQAQEAPSPGEMPAVPPEIAGLPVPMMKENADGTTTMEMTTLGEMAAMMKNAEAGQGKEEGQGDEEGKGDGQGEGDPADEPPDTQREPQGDPLTGDGESAEGDEGGSGSGSGSGGQEGSEGDSGEGGGQSCDAEGGGEGEEEQPPQEDPPPPEGPDISTPGQQLRSPEGELNEQSLDEVAKLFNTGMFGAQSGGWSPNDGN